MRIIAVHLLNDFSGSPKVLMQLINAWTKKNIETHLFTCYGRDGFLSNLNNTKHHFYWYKFTNSKIIRLFYLIVSQFLLFIKLVRFLKKEDVLYINTVLPFGAAFAGKIKKCKVIYHVHETSIKPKILKYFLFKVVSFSAKKIIYVSNFIAQKEPLNLPFAILYNVLEDEFVAIANKNSNYEKKEKIVLMICSLKAYKGVNEFIALANKNPHYIFKLVVNASQEEIDNYFKKTTLPLNCLVYPTQKDTHLFYKEASVVLNLSDKNLWVETFGLTILEAMAYKLPTIVPTVGGVVELVENDSNGYLIDSKNIDEISLKINQILSNEKLYQKLSNNAFEKSKLFNQLNFEINALKIITN